MSLVYRVTRIRRFAFDTRVPGRMGIQPSNFYSTSSLSAASWTVLGLTQNHSKVSLFFTALKQTPSGYPILAIELHTNTQGWHPKGVGNYTHERFIWVGGRSRRRRATS